MPLTEVTKSSCLATGYRGDRPVQFITFKNALSFVSVIFLLAGSAAAGPPRPGLLKVAIRSSAAHPTSAQVLAVAGEVLRDYDSMTVVRLPQTAVEALKTLGTTHGWAVEAEDDWDIVHTPGASIDTRLVGSPASSAAGQARQALYIVEFDSPIAEADQDALRVAGLREISYLPYNAMLVFGSGDAVATVSAYPHVQWTSPYSPSLRAKPVDVSNVRLQEFVVQIVADPGNTHVLQQLRAVDQGAFRASSYMAYTNVHVRTDFATLAAFSADPYIIGFEYAGVDLPSSERDAIGVTQTSVSTSEPYEDEIRPFKPASATYQTWLLNRYLQNNNQYIIALADTGLVASHASISRFNIISKSYVLNEGTTDASGHGTAVASIALGNSVDLDPDSFTWATGLAPTASLFAQKIIPQYPSTDTVIGSETTWAADAINEIGTGGLHGQNWGTQVNILGVVQSHSHNEYSAGGQVGPGDGVYSVSSNEYDAAVRNTGLPVVASAGNICGGSLDYHYGDCSTMVLSPATAKNVLTVGAAESWRPSPAYSACDDLSPNPSPVRQPADFLAQTFHNVAYVSRRGTRDWRLKPEILAPASMVGVANPYGNFCKNFTINGSQYAIDTGTSFAAPQAAAAEILLMQKRGTAMSPAMVKAALIGNSRSLKDDPNGKRGFDDYTNSPIASRPTTVQGYGRLYLGDALATSGITQTFLDESAWTPFTGGGQYRSRSFAIVDQSKKVIVVLAWTDVPATPNPGNPSMPTLVNDLDLEAFPNNTVCMYTGNIMGSDENSAQECSAASFDRWNNVEMIVIPANSGATSFTLRIIEHTWGGGPTQPFAVFASNAY